MPTYGYKCKSCGHTFDAFQGIKDEPLKICPKCGKELHRLITGGSGVIFKGSGFYVTDHNGGGGKSEAGGSTEKCPKAAPSKTGGSESAPCASCCANHAGADAPACPIAEPTAS